MNITKAFCLSMALLGTANIQAMESSDFIIRQDNTKSQQLSDEPPGSSETPVRLASRRATDCAHQATAD